jgi:hypothetical protein
MRLLFVIPHEYPEVLPTAVMEGLGSGALLDDKVGKDYEDAHEVVGIEVGYRDQISLGSLVMGIWRRRIAP